MGSAKRGSGRGEAAQEGKRMTSSDTESQRLPTWSREELDEKFAALVENRTLRDRFRKEQERVLEELSRRDLSTVSIENLGDLLVKIASSFRTELS